MWSPPLGKGALATHPADGSARSSTHRLVVIVVRSGLSPPKKYSLPSRYSMAPAYRGAGSGGRADHVPARAATAGAVGAGPGGCETVNGTVAAGPAAPDPKGSA